MLAKVLQKGDTIGIIAPSNIVTAGRKDLVEQAIKKFTNFGFKITRSPNCFKGDKYKISAGSAQQRADDLNQMFADPKIKAIYCIQGGETANQLLSLIDYENIRKNPKIFLGMSDVDVLHLAIHKKTGLVVFNVADFKSGRDLDLDFSYTWKSFQQRVLERSKKILPASPRTCLRSGIAEGKIIGCNLTSILKLAGTEYFPDLKDSILFLENYFVNINKLISKLEHLRLMGVFEQIKGIVIGYIFGFQDKEERKRQDIKFNYEDVVLRITKDYNFPILKTNDFGHRCPNCCLPIGAKIKLDAGNKTLEIIDDFLI